MPTIAPGGTLKLQIVDQQAIAERLRHILELDDEIAEALAGRDVDLVGLVALLVLDRIQFLEAVETRLALGLAALRALAHPFEFALDRLLPRLFAGFFLLQALVLLLEPGRIVALPGNAAAAVEFEDPLGRVVEEVAIMRDRDDGAGEFLQELLEPFDRFGVEMVGRLVEQQHVGLRQQQAAERDAALLAARQRLDLRFPRRQAQGVGGDFERALERMAVVRGDDRLETLLLGGELVEIGAFLGIGGIDGIELLLRIGDVRHAFLDRLSRTVFSGSSWGSCAR